MYQYIYTYELKSDSSHSLLHSCDNKGVTSLTAKFLFKDETPPSQRKKVVERCRIEPELVSRGTTFQKIYGNMEAFNVYDEVRSRLSRFLVDNLGYRSKKEDDPFKYLGDREFITITPFFFRLGFRLESRALGHMPLEEMISLDALNHFVLTGECSDKKNKI